jgi:predicted nucleotidyltransferase component of viral defense system
VDINTAETQAYDPPCSVPFHVDNPWFAGAAEVYTFTHEEMLATKLRALLQREKGRDLFDLAHALDVFVTLNRTRLVECFNLYLERSNVRIARAEAEPRMLAKLRRPRFYASLRDEALGNCVKVKTIKNGVGQRQRETGLDERFATYRSIFPIIAGRRP